MTVGLPRCGKSTWARESGFPMVNPDSIRLALYNEPFIRGRESEVWIITGLMVRSLFLAGHTTVVLDATNTIRKYRDDWKSPLWKREFKIFPKDLGQCIYRAKETGKNYLIPVIEKMYMEYEPITDEERD